MGEVGVPVALLACADYDQGRMNRLVGEALDKVGYGSHSGSRILVKPNLLRADLLSCTSAAVVRAVCVYLLDHGCTIRLADSPGFGTSSGVARHIGLTAAVADLGIRVESMDSPVPIPLTRGGQAVLSRHALEADAIFSLPRLKAHSQMRVTCAVKNLYGCIPGVRKALYHTRHGDKGNQFPSLIADILAALPPVVAVVDAVIAMHGTGPSGGEPFPAGFLAASPSPVAVDTAIYSLLGLSAADLPLWQELQNRALPGSRASEVKLRGDLFPQLDGFRVPQTLRPESFSPATLVRSLWRRLRASRQG